MELSTTISMLERMADSFPCTLRYNEWKNETGNLSAMCEHAYTSYQLPVVHR